MWVIPINAIPRSVSHRVNRVMFLWVFSNQLVDLWLQLGSLVDDPFLGWFWLYDQTAWGAYHQWFQILGWAAASSDPYLTIADCCELAQNIYNAVAGNESILALKTLVSV